MKVSKLKEWFGGGTEEAGMAGVWKVQRGSAGDEMREKDGARAQSLKAVFRATESLPCAHKEATKGLLMGMKWRIL